MQKTAMKNIAMAMKKIAMKDVIMKDKTMTRVLGGLGVAALIALGLATSLPHLGAAQDPNQGPPPAGRLGGGRGPGGRGMGRGGPGGPMEMAGIDPRDLTDAEREQIKAIRDRHAADMKPVLDRVQNARQALSNAVLTGVGDISGLALEVGSAEGELAFQSAQIETEVLTVLTPEQRQKIQDRQKAMAARRAEMEQRRQSRGAASGNAK
jgi:Spy/CpxP family protein refolding chaperone